MATACRFAAPLGLAPLPRRLPVAAAAVNCGSKVPRNVAIKAANGTSGGEGSTELPEIVKAAQDAWAKVEDKYAVATVGVAALVALWTAVGAVTVQERSTLIMASLFSSFRHVNILCLEISNLFLLVCAFRPLTSFLFCLVFLSSWELGTQGGLHTVTSSSSQTGKLWSVKSRTPTTRSPAAAAAAAD